MAARARPSPNDQGFTLVELMVVLALLGLAAAAVVLTLPASNGGAVTEATRFAARVAALRDRSVIEGRTHGLWVTASGYGFERRGAGGDGPAWQPLNDGRLSRDDWRRGTAVSVDGAAQGRLAFDRVGLPDRAMRIAFTSGDTGATVTIDAAGEVAVR
jgi:general secretion pathway protein H